MKHDPYIQLKTALRAKKVTYRDLSRLLGISYSAVCKKISGVSDFYLSEAVCIRDAYALNIRFFMS